MQKLIGLKQLRAMKIASLRDFCKTEGVLTSGDKSDLVDRLRALPAPAQQQQQQQQPPLGSSVGSKRRRTEQRSQPHAPSLPLSTEHTIY